MDEQEAGSESSQKEDKNESNQNQGEEEKLEAILGEHELDPMEGQAGDALAWLEGPAFDSPIEEMPTLQWPDVEAEAGAADPARAAGAAEFTGDESAPPPDEFEDAMQWLEGLAKEQGTPLDEMPTLISSGESETDGAVGVVAVQGLMEIGDTTPPPQLDSDPMAWLEQLAIDQNSPLEELPSVADRLLASEIVSQTALDGDQELEPLASQPLELEAALKYLEEQAAAQGVSLDEVTFDEVEPVESLDEELGTLDKMVTAAAVATVVKRAVDSSAEMSDDEELEDLPAQIPEDPDEELVWLSELAEEEDSIEQTSPIEQESVSAQESEVDEDKDGSLLKKGAAVVGAAQIAQSLTENDEESESESEQAAGDEMPDVDVLEDMPEAPDEAMVWMGEMAGEESAGEEVDPIEQESASAQESEVDEDKDGSLVKKGAAVVGAAQIAQSLTDNDEEPESESEQATGDEMPDADVLEDMPDDPDEAMLWMGEMAGEESAGEEVGPIEQESASAQESEVDEDKDGSLVKKGAAVVGAAKLAQSLVDREKESEEESTPEADDDVIDPEILEGMPDDPDEAMVWMAGLAAHGAVAEKDESGGGMLDALEETTAAVEGEPAPEQREEFVKAREALAAGDVKTATKQYRDLLDNDQGGPELIEELETAVADQPDEPELLQLLGDVYMQDGQMQKALTTYSKEFDQ